MNYFYNPVHIIHGKNTLNNLSTILNDCNKPEESLLFIVWDSRVLENEIIKNILKKSKKKQIIIYKESNPTIEQLYNIYKKTKDYNITKVVAIGGGSIIDIGKSLCVLYDKEISSVEELRNLIVNKQYDNPKNCKWIGIPTTAGTGSEVTCWATIWDCENNKKYSIESKQNYALYSIIDSQFIEGMPTKLAVSSALDATAHAMESYWAKGTNPISKALALNAIQIIMKNIDKLIEEPNNEEVCEQISLGSMMAGIAFSNTKTTACHSISYPITIDLSIPHGVIVGMLITPVFNANFESIEGREELLKALGVLSKEELEKRINDILNKTKIPNKLSQWNACTNDLEKWTRNSNTKGRMDNNPIELNEDKIYELLESIF